MFNAQPAGYSYTTVLNGHDGQMFAPRHAYEYGGDGSPPPPGPGMGVREYPMMAAHSPQMHDEKLDYRPHDHEDKYSSCAMQDDAPRYTAADEYEKAGASLLHEKHYDADMQQPVVIKLEPNAATGQPYTTLPPFLN